MGYAPAEDSVKIRYQGTYTKNIEEFMCDAVIFGWYKPVRLLQLLVVTIFKYSITNPNPVCSHLIHVTIPSLPQGPVACALYTLIGMLTSTSL
jgi:hypothetical protein